MYHWNGSRYTTTNDWNCLLNQISPTIGCWRWKDSHPFGSHQFRCTDDNCKNGANGPNCGPTRYGSVGCSSRVCRGTPAALLPHCFKTSTGEYFTLDGRECPFCPAGEFPVVDLTDSEKFRCSSAAKSVTPGTVASDQVIQNVCVGLKDVTMIPGYSPRIHSSQYQMKVSKGGVTVFQSAWKNFSSGEDYRIGSEWMYVSNLSDGQYDVTCDIRYPGLPDTYTSTNTFTVSSSAGTSCESLIFDPDEVRVNGTTRANCEVRNAASGKRSIISTKEGGNSCISLFFDFGKVFSSPRDLANSNCTKGFGTKGFTGNILDPYPQVSQLNTYNGLQGYSESGTWNNVCLAFGNARHDGFKNAEKANAPYAAVTSAACGGGGLDGTSGI